MPKLKEDSLKKTFTCPLCHKLFRTRQGLSGHILFKHQKKYIKEPDLTITLKIAKKLKIIDLSDFSTVPLNEIVDMVKFWNEFKLIFEAFDIELNQQDLKHYMITSLVQIYQNQRLKEKIIKALIGMTGE